MRERFRAIKHPAVVYVCGRRGCGKTHTVIELINEWHELEAAAGVPAGSVHVVDPVGPDDCQDPRYLNHHGDTWSRGMVDTLPENCSLVVVDEADTVLGVTKADQHPVAMDLVRRGRHRGVTLALCVQRPAEVSRTAWALADVLIAHRTTDARDLERIGKLSDAAELVAAAPRLDVGAAAIWTPEGTTVVSADDRGAPAAPMTGEDDERQDAPASVEAGPDSADGFADAASSADVAADGPTRRA